MKHQLGAQHTHGPNEKSTEMAAKHNCVHVSKFSQISTDLNCRSLCLGQAGKRCFGSIYGSIAVERPGLLRRLCKWALCPSSKPTPEGC